MASGDPVIDGKTTDLMNCVNVKASPYNAVGNRVANDTSAINAAIAVANASGATLFFPSGHYLVVAGSLSVIQTNVDGPDAIIQAYDTTNAPLISHAFYALLEDENAKFFRLRALFGYGVSHGQVNPSPKYGQGLFLGADHVRGNSYEIQQIMGFTHGLYMDGSVGDKHVASNKFILGYILGNTYGIFLRAGALQVEANRFEVELFQYNANTIYCHSHPDEGAWQFVCSNLFDVTCMELHQQTGDTGIVLYGANVYQNTFRINGSLVPGTGMVIWSGSAQNNRFQLSTCPFNKITMDAGNVFDLRTSEIGYPTVAGQVGRSRSVFMGSAPPTNFYCRVGDICWNTVPVAGGAGTLLWACTTAGLPATWTALTLH